MAKKMPWAVEQTARNVATVRCTDVKAGWEQWALLRSDVHHDNPHCDWDMERRHLEEAKDRKALIIDNGDLFCAMQGAWDPRKSKDSIRPEHNTGDYLDKLVKTAAKFYEPYAENFAVIGLGNHETAIRKRHETCLSTRLVEAMNGYGSPVLLSGYSGWVRFMFNVNGAYRSTKILHHYHGSGGGGPVTRGVIQTNRLAVIIPDADIILSGHTHDDFYLPIARTRLSERCTVYQTETHFIRPAGYKDSWGDGFGGWEVETMKGPKPKSAYWLRFYLLDNQIKLEAIRAT